MSAMLDLWKVIIALRAVKNCPLHFNSVIKRLHLERFTRHSQFTLNLFWETVTDLNDFFFLSFQLEPGCFLPSPAVLRRKIIIKNKKKHHHHHKKNHGASRSSTMDNMTAEVTGNGDIPHAPPLQQRQGSKESQNDEEDNGQWVFFVCDLAQTIWFLSNCCIFHFRRRRWEQQCWRRWRCRWRTETKRTTWETDGQSSSSQRNRSWSWDISFGQLYTTCTFYIVWKCWK